MNCADVSTQDDGCPRGKRRCPGERKKHCIPKYKFCDGENDCKGGTDENPYYCRELVHSDVFRYRNDKDSFHSFIYLPSKQ